MSKIIRLYRACSINDIENNYLLNSSINRKLNNSELMPEIISQELNSDAKRRVLYSFTTDLNIAKDICLKEKRTEIRYIDINLESETKTVLSIHPVFEREYLIRCIANFPDALINKKIKNPVNNYEHTILGLVNYSQRTVAGLAHSWSEVMVQPQVLQLYPLDEIQTEITKTQTENNLRDYIKSKYVAPEAVKQLREIFIDTFATVKLEKRLILDKILTDEWFRVA